MICLEAVIASEHSWQSICNVLLWWGRQVEGIQLDEMHQCAFEELYIPSLRCTPPCFALEGQPKCHGPPSFQTASKAKGAQRPVRDVCLVGMCQEFVCILGSAKFVSSVAEI